MRGTSAISSTLSDGGAMILSKTTTKEAVALHISRGYTAILPGITEDQAGE